ncbi:MAG: PAS domain-containing protein, partial [Acidobacteriota bacterium]
MGAERWVGPRLHGALGRRDIYYRIDLQGRIQEISPSVTAVTGYQPSELMGREVTEAYLDGEMR